MKLLLIEDTVDLADLMRQALTSEGFAVDVAGTVGDAELLMEVAPPDVMVLDLGLPDGDGRDLLKRLRRNGCRVPILVVTARAGLNDRIEGLDGGADDYLVKPAAPAEIAARCRALLRRPAALANQELAVGGIALDVASRRLFRGATAIPLAPRDVAVLEVLMRRVGTVVQRGAIEAAVYSMAESPGPNALEAAVSRIRKALGPSETRVALHTIRGVGYMLEQARTA